MSLNSTNIERYSTVLDKEYVVVGHVVQGYKRGRELGWPTANIESSAFDDLDLDSGVYVGWCTISSSPNQVYPSVLSIGYNPTFENQNKSVEVHICHDFQRDFYDDVITLLICGYIRPQLKIPFEKLKTEIGLDVDFGLEMLRTTLVKLKKHSLFN